MKSPSHRVLTLLCVQAGMLALLNCRQADAIAIFDARATAETALVSSGGTVAFPLEENGFALGPATTGTGAVIISSGTNDVEWGTQETRASGSAAYPPASTSLLRRETHDFIRVENTSLIDVVTDFTLTFDVESMVSTTEVGDFAFSDYNIHITGIGDPIDATGESATFSLDGGSFVPVLRLGDAVSFPPLPPDAREFQLDVAQEASGPGGSDSSSMSGVVTVRYTTPADSTTSFSIFTRAGNFASANGAVPEPSTLIAVCAGMFVVFFRRRRRM
jgi:hypothetical protein